MDCRGASVNGAFKGVSIDGLKLRAFENGSLEVVYEICGQKFECMLDKQRTVHITRLPLTIAWALREDIENSSLDAALAKLPKRLKAYVMRQQQVENMERKHSRNLLGGKLQTAGSYSFIRADLLLRFGNESGVLRLDMWYDDFSVHAKRTVVRCRGPSYFVELIQGNIEDIEHLLQSLPLDEACDALCETYAKLK